MDKFSRQSAAYDLEFAAEMHGLAIKKLEEVAMRFPELKYFVTEYIQSISEGEPQLGGITVVAEFLRNGRDSVDHFAEGYLLGWKKSQTE